MLIERYIAREVRSAVLFVLVAFLGLFAFFDFVSQIEDVGRGGYTVRHALAYVVLGLPSHVYEVMPIAVLIGGIYAMSQFAASSEFTAMRAAGMGRMRALTAMLRSGVLLVLVTAFVGEVVAPQAERLAQGIRMSAIGTAVGGQFRSGIWIKDTLRGGAGDVERQRYVNITELEPDATMRGVRIYEFDESFRLARIVQAGTGRYESAGRWRLDQVTEIAVEHQGVAGAVEALRVQRVAHASMPWRSELTPDLLGVLLVTPERMSAWHLLQYVQHLRDNQQSSGRYEMALWKKIIYPLAVLVMLALALPSAYMQVRAGGVGYKVFAGIMLGVAFHFLNGLFSHLGMLNTWPPWLSVSLPSLAALLLALSMLAWVDRVR